MLHDQRPAKLSGMAYAGMGLEFAGAVIGFCLLGWWIDRHWQIEKHWGVIICGALGIVGGLYNLIRQALRAAGQEARANHRESPAQNDESTKRGNTPPHA